MGNGYNRFLQNQIDNLNLARVLKEEIYSLLERLKENHENDKNEINPLNDDFTINDLLEFIEVNGKYHDAAEDLIYDWRKEHESK